MNYCHTTNQTNKYIAQCEREDAEEQAREDAINEMIDEAAMGLTCVFNSSWGIDITSDEVSELLRTDKCLDALSEVLSSVKARG